MFLHKCIFRNKKFLRPYGFGNSSVKGLDFGYFRFLTKIEPTEPNSGSGRVRTEKLELQNSTPSSAARRYPLFLPMIFL